MSKYESRYVVVITTTLEAVLAEHKWCDKSWVAFHKLVSEKYFLSLKTGHICTM